MAWLVDNAAAVYFLLGLVGLGLAAGWWITRHRQLLLALAAVALVVGLVWLLSLLIDTDRKILKRTVQEMAQGVREKNEHKIFPHLSKSFSWNNMNLKEFRENARQEIRRGRIDDLEVSKFSFLHVARDEGKARVEFWVHTVESGVAPVRCEADFVFEDGAWRMIGFELFMGNFPHKWHIPRPD